MIMSATYRSANVGRVAEIDTAAERVELIAQWH